VLLARLPVSGKNFGGYTMKMYLIALAVAAAGLWVAGEVQANGRSGSFWWHDGTAANQLVLPAGE
jgi:hypothetical protein